MRLRRHCLVAATSLPNPPPRGGRGLVVAAVRIPSPLEGEGWEGGKPREESRQQAS
jgi:hypothetical protein